ncbi:fibronectin type III domain-containing protein [Arenibacter certesii]|uniref:fibronectin type III domain-containing protein n=1 Tax=Arenibacter certesii TaxID=228955 RepID=UPI0012FAF5D1|nr:hypothetical protein [Arenibacter certesii]
MKHILPLILLLVSWVNAQEKPSVQVIARSLPDKVLLRWAVDEPLAWKKSNEYGFLIEKSTISRNGEAVIPIERQQLVSAPLKPRPLAEWEVLAVSDQSAAVLAQALYGDSFITESPKNAMGKIYAVNDELEQRFTFALLAAEQNFEAAKLAGWAFEDTNVKPGEKYVYKIMVATPIETSLDIIEGSVFASPDLYEELPKPIGLAAVFADENVMLSWNFNLLQHVYTSYVIERSDDNNNFKQLNGVPIFNAQESNHSQEASLFYTDSIPNNTNFYYRIKGKTAFGETGPSTEPLLGKATKNLGFVPRIYKKEIPSENNAVLYWEFDKNGNDLIKGFEVRRANKEKGPFETVKTGLSVTERQTTVTDLKRINYYTVVALGKNGVESESYATMVQPIDSTPPAPPIGFHAIVDSTGIIKLSWTKNLEDDLGGYRIFQSNRPDMEFSELTNSTLRGETFVDTIPINNLNQKVHYKIVAEDLRYNRSGFSEILSVDKPDIVPPTSPLLNNYLVTKEGIQLSWNPSCSVDVSSHVVYRKMGNTPEMVWERLYESFTNNDSLYYDKTLKNPGLYNYTVIAKDSVGLESLPANPISIVWNGKILSGDDIKLQGAVNRELRFINLSWKVKSSDVIEFRLYRGVNSRQLKLYKTLAGNSKGFNDTDLEINTDYTYGLQLVLNGGLNSLIKEINLKY